MTNRFAEMLILPLALPLAGCAVVSSCPLRDSGVISGAQHKRQLGGSLFRTVGTAVRRFGFIPVTETHDPIVWYSLGSSFSKENIRVFIDPRRYWISVKDYNHGRRTKFMAEIESAIQVKIASEYGAKIHFRSESDCLG